jgi:2-oxoglutarate ferredoxin oxidoreductase subunit gamma
MQQLLKEIRIAGFGGQGVILAATVIGKAVALYQEGFATMTQNFGPEARGGACSAQVILSSDPILYPYVTRPDVLAVMSQEAYRRFVPELKRGGVLLIEQDLVHINGIQTGTRVFGVPATRLAEELGRKVVLNIVIVGFFCAVTRLVEAEALRKAVAESVPSHLVKLNLQAFDKGFENGLQTLDQVLNGAEPELVISELESVP